MVPLGDVTMKVEGHIPSRGTWHKPNAMKIVSPSSYFVMGKTSVKGAFIQQL